MHDSSTSSPPLDLSAAPEPQEAVNRHGDPLFMSSFARGLLVIRAFTGRGRRRTVSEISRATGLSRAAVRRCLYTLCQLGYAQCERRAYWLLPKVLGISHGAVPAAVTNAREVRTGPR
jgi:IclR family pca regulon transcriptional regulator